jgi:hypothetical protein
MGIQEVPQMCMAPQFAHTSSEAQCELQVTQVLGVVHGGPGSQSSAAVALNLMLLTIKPFIVNQAFVLISGGWLHT